MRVTCTAGTTILAIIAALLLRGYWIDEPAVAAARASAGRTPIPVKP